MRTVGIDLAAEPKKTAAAVLEWSGGQAVVQFLALNQSDAELVDLVMAADKAGIDCPLGWPEPFIEFLTAQRNGQPLPPTNLEGRKTLAYRRTDFAVRDEVGVMPLSVAADRIGHTAMRAAGLLALLADRGCRVDRAGTGVVVEAYPAAALRRWQLYRHRYKGADCRPVREALVNDLTTAMPALRIGVAETERCCEYDDALDAVLCALIARAAALGKIQQPDEGQAALAATEGWIAVPTCRLDELSD